MKIRWVNIALDSLEAIVLMKAEDNPLAVSQIIESIEQALEQLQTFPNMGRPGFVSGTRERIIPESPYTIVYQNNEDYLDILFILDNS